MTRSTWPRRGVTLVELLVTLSILAILSAVTTLAIRRFDSPRADDPRTVIADSVRIAADSARTAYIRMVVAGVPASATVGPDGTVVADSAFRVDRFTGRPLDAR